MSVVLETKFVKRLLLDFALRLPVAASSGGISLMSLGSAFSGSSSVDALTTGYIYIDLHHLRLSRRTCSCCADFLIVLVAVMW